jgi:tetratricopeptide (TPR) repeat protein/O-antigen ligase
VKSHAVGWKYLAKEATLILGLSYALWLGGTFNGLIFFTFRRFSLIGMLIVGIVWLASRRRSAWPNTERLSIPLLVMLLAFGLATITSSDPRRSLIILWQIGMALWLFWLTGELLTAGWPAELMVKSVLVTGTVVIVMGAIVIINWYLGWWEIGGASQPIPPVILRIWSLPGHPNFVAATLNLMWPLALSRLLGRRGWLMRAVLIVWVLGAWFVLMFTSSRGGWLGAAAALSVLLVLWVLDRGGRKWFGKLRQLARDRLPLTLVVTAFMATVVVGLFVVAVAQLGHPSHIPALMSREAFWTPAWAAFRRSPWLGVGPLTYFGEYNNSRSIPPESIFTHGHSVPLNVLAEAGLVGFLALMGVVGSAGWGLLRAWRSTRPGRRVELMGAIAALISASVHGLFDTVQMMPTLVILLVIVGAIGLYRPSPEERGRRWSVSVQWAAPLLWMALMATGIWSLWGYAPAAKGVLAGNLRDWEGAVPLLEKAVERDPALAINHFHAGYARGALAADDPAQLEPAIAHYRVGITHDPTYAPHHANLAALLWAAGQREEAIDQMETAREMAPLSALFPLNLGVFFEESGDEDAAIKAYEQAAVLGGAEASFFWRSSSLREAAFKHAVESEATEAEDGFEALAQGDMTAATRIFEEELVHQPNSVFAYRGLSAIALAQGDEEKGAYYLQVAQFIGSTYHPREHIRARMDWARLEASRGELRKAIDLATSVLDTFRHQTFWGFDRYGTADYGWYIYYRESFLEDVLPQIKTAGVPDEVGAWMLEVAGWAKQEEDLDLAEALCREALEAVPDSLGARECLDGLAD